MRQKKIRLNSTYDNRRCNFLYPQENDSIGLTEHVSRLTVDSISLKHLSRQLVMREKVFNKIM